jgi:D-proline reductase (dithiol) PrdB
MAKGKKNVDGFKFLPPKLSAWIKSFIPEREFNGEIPFHRLSKPLSKCRLALITTAGISLKSDPPFDMEREKSEPTWGDRSYRSIPKDTKTKDIEINHLHINCDYVKKDLNVMLPLDRIEELAVEGIVGELAPTSYSFYGFQWESDQFLDTAIRPMIDQMKTESVEAVLLTPA